jgi:hypothetical protein
MTIKTKKFFEPNTDKPNDGSLTIICEPDHFPCSYDAYWLIVNAMALARINNYQDLRFWFRGFEDSTTPRTGLGSPMFIKGPVKDILDMYGLPIVQESTGHWAEKIPYNMSAACNIYRRWNAIPPSLHPAEQSLEWAQQFKECITITLRMTRYYHQYNSLLYDWMDVAECLRKGGHRVIFIPDTRYPDFKILDCETSPRAAVNTHDRAALYRVASQNFFVANGPCTLCKCTNDVPYVQFVTNYAVKAMEVMHTKFEFFDIAGLGVPENADVYHYWLGFGIGEQCPWANTAIQRHVWKDDTFENIIETIGDMYPGSCKNFSMESSINPKDAS